ncbi:hypothetical protein GCM10011579_086620 [Streptomyces albiflavescens]|uniref:Uncharacterized protein n=1 Tax=Streptomyces albiflavescens TaxID=1623582 RepID=A0A917YEU8_9ACTN|nr:hypothetical protein [Streptomyces albiflavescens]GGN90595.1 hypothetical protein GCM10011579_086620 [Streptomyces albiflavescens]
MGDDSEITRAGRDEPGADRLGVDSSADILCWGASGEDPGIWPVLVYNRDDSLWSRYDCGMVEFLSRLLRADLDDCSPHSVGIRSPDASVARTVLVRCGRPTRQAFVILGFTSWSVMFDITFVPDSMRDLTEKQLAKLERASEMDLRYEYFKADLSIAADEFGNEQFPVTPALDFVFCVLLAAGDIRQGNPGRISFTENDLLIHFTRDGETVTVTRSWDPVPGHCTVAEFLAVAARFSTDVLEFIARRYPAFQANPARGKLVGMVGELKAS